MLLSSAIQQVAHNPGLKVLAELHLFTLNFATNRVTDHTTKVNIITKVNALVPPQDLNTLSGFSLEISGSATGIARQKVVNFHAHEQIYKDRLMEIANMPVDSERQDALCDLVLGSLARMQYVLIMREINKGKDYSELRNSKAFQEWQHDKPLKPDTEGLVDSTNIIDATYQAVSAPYLDFVMYLNNVIKSEVKPSLPDAA